MFLTRYVKLTIQPHISNKVEQLYWSALAHSNYVFDQQQWKDYKYHMSFFLFLWFYLGKLSK